MVQELLGNQERIIMARIRYFCIPLLETVQPIMPYLTSCWRSYREGRRRMVIRCENILLALKQFLIIHPRIFQVKINDFSFSSLQSKVLWRTLIKPLIEFIFFQIHALVFCTTRYRGSPPYAFFGTWKKPCYMKLVLVGLYCGPLLTLIPPLTRT